MPFTPNGYLTEYSPNKKERGCEEVLKVYLTGSHGTGKTWLSNRLTEFFGERYPGQVQQIPSVTRYVRALGVEDPLAISLACMEYRRHLESSLPKDTKLVFSERCIWDDVAYIPEEYRDSELFRGLMKQARKHMESLSPFVVFFKPIKEGLEVEDDGTRSLDPDFQKEVEDTLWTFTSYLKPLTLPEDNKDCFEVSCKEIESLVDLLGVFND